MARYEISTTSSTVLVSARSSMGPIVFEAREVAGDVEAEVADGVIRTEPGPTARLEVDLRSLRSGNDLYDAELQRRIDARRHPRCLVELERTDALTAGRFALVGSMHLHGSSRPVHGTVEVTVTAPGRLVAIGEKTVDIRDFDLPAPSILLLKIYPEVQVKLFIEARLAPTGDARAEDQP